MKVLIAGGTGLIGKKIISLLSQKGFEINLLSRKKVMIPGVNSFIWNPENMEIDPAAFKDVDSVINLSGAGIAEERWTEKRKNIILESRIKAVDTLKKGIIDSDNKPKSFIGASATGYYGGSYTENIYSETDSPANDFLGNTCKKWEESYVEIEKLGIRTCVVRIGIVLSREGGAYPKMRAPVALGLGSALGSGKQWMPWVHIDDVTGIFHHLVLTEGIDGAFNAVADECINNSGFMKRIAQKLRKPFFLPAVPGFLLKTMLGEMAIIVLGSSRVGNQKIKKSGYTFNYPDLDSALDNLA